MIQEMRKIIPFMALMKEVSFIVDINLTKQEVFKEKQNFIVVP